MNAQDEPVRFGLVGCGAWGSQHARAIAKTSGAQFAAIAEQSEQNRAAAQTVHPGAAIYADYQEMLRKEKLEVVDIVLPPHLHYQGAKAARPPAAMYCWKNQCACSSDNGGRIVAASALVLSGWLKSLPGMDLRLAITLLGLFFPLGLVIIFFLPETKDQPLPE